MLLVSSCQNDFEEFEEEIENESNAPMPNNNEGALNRVFSHALISDAQNNLDRENPIIIKEHDIDNNRIKVNYPDLFKLKRMGTNGESWFICQGNQNSVFSEIIDVDITSRWITYGGNYLGSVDYSVGMKIEFFNPFVNYEIIPNRETPLFNPYPTPKELGLLEYHYLLPLSVFQKPNKAYVLLFGAVIGNHIRRQLYSASSADLVNWTVNGTPETFLDNLPFGDGDGRAFITGNPIVLDSGNLLFTFGVTHSNDSSSYMGGYFITDSSFNIIGFPKQINIPGYTGTSNNFIPMSSIKYNGKFRLLFHRRLSQVIDRDNHEFICDSDDASILDMLDSGNYQSTSVIHKGSDYSSNSYLWGHSDNNSYFIYENELYLLSQQTAHAYGWVTHWNREQGLIRLVDNDWLQDSRNPLIVNPVQLFRKYDDMFWNYDHLGGIVCPILKDGYLYQFLTMASDNPDYFISCVKTKL